MTAAHDIRRKLRIGPVCFYQKFEKKKTLTPFHSIVGRAASGRRELGSEACRTTPPASL